MSINDGILKSMSKGFTQVYILLAVLVLVVLGVAYSSGKLFTKPSTQPQISTTSTPAADETTNWKTYTNTKYGYLLKYPNNLPAYNGLATSKKDEVAGMETTDSVTFGCSGFEVGVCLPPFTIGQSSPYLEETQINDLFNLKVGDQTTKDMTYKLGGAWNQKTNYTRLADQVANDINLLVLDNPNGYGGSNRIWFVKKNGTVLQVNCIYANQNFLNTCQNIVSTFKFLDQNQADIANWKTYTAKNNEFSFKYPFNWYYEPVPGYETHEVSFFVNGIKADHGYGDHKGNEAFTVDITDDDRSIQTLKSNYYPNGSLITVANKPALETTFGLIIVQVAKNRQLTLTRGSGGAETDIKNILSTFKFN